MPSCLGTLFSLDPTERVALLVCNVENTGLVCLASDAVRLLTTSPFSSRTGRYAMPFAADWHGRLGRTTDDDRLGACWLEAGGPCPRKGIRHVYNIFLPVGERAFVRLHRRRSPIDWMPVYRSPHGMGAWCSVRYLGPGAVLAGSSGRCLVAYLDMQSWDAIPFAAVADPAGAD